MEGLEETLQFGVMRKKEVDELQAVAMSLGRIMASATLLQWELKVHGTKTLDKKVEEFATKVSAMKLLERANYKRRRNEKKKLADKVAMDNLGGKGRTSEQAKLAYHIFLYKKFIKVTVNLSGCKPPSIKKNIWY